MYGQDYIDGSDHRLDTMQEYLHKHRHRYTGRHLLCADNYKQTPRGLEKFRRDACQIGRSVMPETSLHLPPGFLELLGYATATLYHCADVITKDFPDASAKNWLRHIGNSAANNPHDPDSMFLQQASNTIGWPIKRIREQAKRPGQDCKWDVWFLNSLCSWLAFHRTWFEVSPYTSELLSHCDVDDSDQRAAEWASFLPSVMLADSRTNNVFLCNAVWDEMPTDGMKIEEVKYSTVEIGYVLGGTNKDGFTCGIVSMDDTETYEFVCKRMRNTQHGGQHVDDCLRWALNAMSLANSHPKYITASGRKSNSGQRKEHKHDNPMSLTAELCRPVTGRTLMQVVTEGGEDAHMAQAMTSAKTPHIRRGHVRRQPHGQRFEINNPDTPIFTDRHGKRYHKKQIWPIMVNSALRG